MKKSTLALAAAAAVTLVAAAIAEPPQIQLAQASKAGEILAKAQGYHYLIRIGRFDVVPELVAMLEDATAKTPDEAGLWATLGNAYYMQAIAAQQPGQNLAEAPKALQRALATHERALEADPNNPVALIGRGQGRTIMARFQNKPELVTAGIADMNRGIELAPQRVDIRLVRAFTSLNLPANLRDPDVVIDDLTRIAGSAGDSRQNAAVRVLLGDIYAEAGKTELARSEYARAAKSPTPPGEKARARLAALDAGGVPVADIAAMRAGIGGNCVMCHGS